MTRLVNDRDYNIRAEFPEFEALDDGRFRCLAQTLDDGRYIVMTDMGGMDYPEFDDFMVCIYRDEEAFGDDPSEGLLGSFASDRHDDIETALDAAVWLTLGDLK